MERYHLAAICAVTSGLGRKHLPALVEKLGGAERVWSASFAELLATGLVTPQQAEGFTTKRTAALPQRLEHFCNQQGIKLLTYADADYPRSLQHLHDKPLVLYVRGELPVAPYALAIVGSRAASEYGLQAAQFFSETLAQQGIPIISGGARGIDTAAHRACLAVGGKTVAVLGCGIDKVFPAENKKLFQQIVEQGGAVVSEYAPGMPPIAKNFPARNRIIVGLSQGVLVAEAKLKSGAIITANIAADEGRDVYCVPGNIFYGTSVGCHQLIRNGAQLVDSPQCILQDLADWQSQKEQGIQPSLFALAETDKENGDRYAEVSDLGKQLLKLLAKQHLSLTEIIEYLPNDIATVSLELLELQAAGLVAQDNAQAYYLT